MPAIRKEATRLDSLIATSERKLPSAHMHQKTFLQSAESASSKNGTACQSLEVRHKSLGLYEWKLLKLTVSGFHDAILKTLADIDNTGRLISWEDVCYRTVTEASARTEAVAIVKIFAYPTDPDHNIKPIGREIKTHTWLPPFSSEVKTLQQEAVQAYDLLMSEPGVEEQLRFIEIFKEKKIRFERMKSILSELEQKRRSLDQAIINSRICN